jgi:hypothetical protein
MKAVISNTFRICTLSAALTVFAFFQSTVSSAGNAQPAGTEQRFYDVRIDRKPAGAYQLKLEDSGSRTDLTSMCDIDYHVLIFRYRYTYRGHEHWKGSRLEGMDSLTNDDGKRCALSVQAGDGGLLCTLNGKQQHLPETILTSSYWRLQPSLDKESQFLEVDSGRLFTARLEWLGTQTLTIGGRPQACKHFRLSGGDDGELWYDSSDRLVRQTSNSDGHATEVVLQRVEHL